MRHERLRPFAKLISKFDQEWEKLSATEKRYVKRSVKLLKNTNCWWATYWAGQLIKEKYIKP